MHGNELNEKRFFWLKLDRHFFGNGRVKKLRKIAGGDTYTIIYLKMLLLSVEYNGMLIYEGIEDEFYKEIALKLDEEESDCQVTINYLLSQGLLVETQEQNFHFPDIIGMIGSETKNNVYKRQKRLEKFQPNSNQIPKLSNQIPIEKEIDIEKDKEIDINNKIKDIYVDENIPCVCAREEKSSSSTLDNLETNLNNFLEEFGIVLDSYTSVISEIDFKLLAERFRESAWLKANISSFKKVCEYYPKIISGYYKDYDKKPKEDKSWDRLKAMLEEAKKEEGGENSDTQ